jgi:hypothetical protein
MLRSLWQAMRCMTGTVGERHRFIERGRGDFQFGWVF